jgi:hypothetical protein
MNQTNLKNMLVQQVFKLLAAHVIAYCETTTIHGFSYCASAPRLLEKLFWVAVVCTGFLCAGLIVSSPLQEWRDSPGVVSINSFFKVCDVCKVSYLL